MESYYMAMMEGGGHIDKERLFEKPLTPSDVGKLNRLVIPKQHAERYFPLAANSSSGESGEKGLLLSFEDELGKSWRFRYSYWTSSQSYVLTKGWSRFVKEKHLDAGDVVLFESNSHRDRLFIGCRRRGEPAPAVAAQARNVTDSGNAALSWAPAFYGAASSSYNTSPSTPYTYHNSVQQDCHLHAGDSVDSGMAAASLAPAATSKTLRLFGVNLECSPDHY